MNAPKLPEPKIRFPTYAPNGTDHFGRAQARRLEVVDAASYDHAVTQYAALSKVAEGMAKALKECNGKLLAFCGAVADITDCTDDVKALDKADKALAAYADLCSQQEKAP